MDNLVVADEITLNGEKETNLSAKISSLLFVSIKPISTVTLAETCKVGEDQILDTIEQLQQDFIIDKYGFSIYQRVRYFRRRNS